MEYLLSHCAMFFKEINLFNSNNKLTVLRLFLFFLCDRVHVQHTFVLSVVIVLVGNKAKKRKEGRREWAEEQREGPTTLAGRALPAFFRQKRAILTYPLKLQILR